MESFPFFFLHWNICCMTACGLLHGPFAYVCAFLCVRVWLVIVYASTSRTLEGLLQRPLIGGVDGRECGYR